MRSTMTWKVLNTVAIAIGVVIGWHATAKADETVKVCARTDCSLSGIPDFARPSSGRLTFTAPHSCTFLALANPNRRPLVWKIEEAVPPPPPAPVPEPVLVSVAVKVEDDRKEFSVEHGYAEGTCLHVRFHITTGVNDPADAGNMVDRDICIKADAPPCINPPETK